MKNKTLEELSEEDRRFLDNASRSLDIDKYGEFLLKWANALEAYGTPRDFVDDTYHEEHVLKINNQTYKFMVTTAPGNERRRELSAKQKKYEPRDNLDSYGVRFASNIADCFLCENVVQGIDAQRHPSKVRDNVVVDLGMHYILPNRYPSEYGHSLSVLKDHDDLSTRGTVIPVPEEKTAMIKPEPNKTRGNLLSVDYFEAVIEACDKYALIGLRNHALEGMSLPVHEHFHVFPRDSMRFTQISVVTREKETTPFGANVYYAKNTPFDTLLIIREAGKPISNLAIPLLKNMEEDNQIFTLFYDNGILFVSPRIAERFNDKRQQVGACMPVHSVDVSMEETLRRANTFIPMKGQYGWEKFI